MSSLISFVCFVTAGAFFVMICVHFHDLAAQGAVLIDGCAFSALMRQLHAHVSSLYSFVCFVRVGVLFVVICIHVHAFSA